MGQFVDENESGSPLQHGLEVHLFQPRAAILDLLAWDQLQAAQQQFGVASAVSLNVTNDDIDTFRL